MDVLRALMRVALSSLGFLLIAISSNARTISDSTVGSSATDRRDGAPSSGLFDASTGRVERCPSLGANVPILRSRTLRAIMLGVRCIKAQARPAGFLRLPDWRWTPLTVYSFAGGADGSLPADNLVGDASGALYGTTGYEGPFGGGTVFQLVPPVAGKTGWTLHTLYAFSGHADGANPRGIATDTRGNLYGFSTLTDSLCPQSEGCGMLFKLTPPVAGRTVWSLGILHVFSGKNGDGAAPNSGIVFDRQGSVYGTTGLGGDANCHIYDYQSGCGTVYGLVPAAGDSAWTQRILYTFTGAGTDAMYPRAGLAADADGNLFGTTLFGGGKANGYGTVFALKRPANGQTGWREGVIHRFGGFDGSAPIGAVTLDHGTVYGTTSEGGTKCHVPGYVLYGCGAVFAIARATGGQGWIEHVIHSFGGTDGAVPSPTLLALNGTLYGATFQGGNADYLEWGGGPGVVFQLLPPQFDNQVDWQMNELILAGQTWDVPSGGLINVRGVRYGPASGGPYNRGLIYKVHE